MRVGVIDCGTNTTRILICDGDVSGVPQEVVRELRFTRLGEGVDRSGSFTSDGLKRTFAAVEEYAQMLEAYQVDTVRFVATSAARDVHNREDFISGVRTRLGIEPEIISGEEEAYLSFLGALTSSAMASDPPLAPVTLCEAELPPVTLWSTASRPSGLRSAGSATRRVHDQPPNNDQSVLVVDIGGGSTELIRGFLSGRLESRVSLDMGSVRLRERYLHGDPLTVPQIDQARSFVSELLDGCGVAIGDVDVFIGVAGTLTSLSGMNQSLDSYDRTKVHNSTLEVDDILTLQEHLLTLSVDEVINQYPSLPAPRAEVIGAGALIASEIARRVGRTMIVRETDILDGAAMQLFREPRSSTWHKPIEV
ncbi:MAG: exopolyphosphatase [Propionibacteriaceae bacterium]|nr:exopolyphosphatase [Propionibacteriaceae bacterium]